MWIPVALISKKDEDALVNLDQDVKAKWAQVENVYQRRADLVPNLIAAVESIANSEKETIGAVTEASSKVKQSKLDEKMIDNPEAFSMFQHAQDGLSSALSRLMIVVEKYPELKATQNFRDLQVQLEQTENRITVERMRYNEAALEFNRLRISSDAGKQMNEKQYFKAQK